MSRDIIAILRGLRPEEAVEVGTVIVEAGITTIEVPLNSPEPLRSIRLLSDALSDRATIGAGTVLTVREAEEVAGAGGRLVVSPNAVPDVIARTKALGLASYPGVLTPTECFAALAAGADGLKFFPASLLGVDGLKAVKAVLPRETKTYAVGGAGPSNFDAWLKAGITGFGIGSNLFSAGMTAGEVGRRAQEIVSAYDQALAGIN
ncbi:2-dehydro-3-deoxy-6-phosphogalactonate aldolase [Vannielia litorea]|uniref:2-keto-3-deoxy-phosphogalactonate aldolase n=1 Tax=Vannielia litorea TaxID=1217970 RepID=A0A1N6E071_9RHOB|nr:2-dehydro-3-deoxy-6-phosphogalactonate aldolase [Vannielia litorea]SIN76426.1 2-keto-3-deoxy-phosphogalactonate aldolase [Vannielia litorea]